MTAVLAWLVFYLVTRVPIAAAHPPDPELQRHQVTAVALYLLMALADVAMVLMIRRGLRRRGDDGALEPRAAGGRTTHALRLTFNHVTPSTVLAAGAVSLVVLLATAAIGLPLWAIAVSTLVPWVPIYVQIARWQFREIGLYAVFTGVVVLQLGHLAEHVAQNVELIASHGNVMVSQGVFGALNQEAVHFFWNVLILAGTAFLLSRFGRHNPWLWISFFVASFHGVEHFYLYWLYLTDYHHYVLSASAGILAKGGLVATPLARPYLHLVYNYVEIVPFLFAFWDTGASLRVRTDADRPARLSGAEAIQLTS